MRYKIQPKKTFKPFTVEIEFEHHSDLEFFIMLTDHVANVRPDMICQPYFHQLHDDLKKMRKDFLDSIE